MKKTAYIAFALTLGILVSCKSNKSGNDDNNMNNMDTTATSVAPGASDQMQNMDQDASNSSDDPFNRSDEDEAFGTDLNK